MKCSNCGTDNPNDSLYCVSCGNIIKQEDRKKLRITLIIVSVLCAVFIASTTTLAILYIHTKKELYESKEAYQELIKEKDSYRDSYNKLYEKREETNTYNKPSKEELDEYIRNYYDK